MKLKRISFGEYTINIDGVKLMDLNDEFTNACLVPRENQINIINKNTILYLHETNKKNLFLPDRF